VAVALMFAGADASAQAPRDATKNWCFTTARLRANELLRLRDADPQRRADQAPRRSPTHTQRGRWENSILDYMAHAIAASPILTRDELERLGFTYCIERRPAGY